MTRTSPGMEIVLDTSMRKQTHIASNKTWDHHLQNNCQ